jgi:hypothetical protein
VSGKTSTTSYGVAGDECITRMTFDRIGALRVPSDAAAEPHRNVRFDVSLWP